MKQRPESLTILTIFVFLSMLLLTSCADTKVPSWLTGEPDDSVLNAPRVVGTPPSIYGASFPNLATVPDKPKNFSAKAERQKFISTMTEDKAEAQDIKERLEAISASEAGSSAPAQTGTFLQFPAPPQQGGAP